MITSMHLTGLLATMVYSIIGMGMFVLSYKVLDWLTHFSLDKELLEDQNVAIGVVVGAMMLGMAIIIASAMH